MVDRSKELFFKLLQIKGFLKKQFFSGSGHLGQISTYPIIADLEFKSPDRTTPTLFL